MVHGELAGRLERRPGTCKEESQELTLPRAPRLHDEKAYHKTKAGRNNTDNFNTTMRDAFTGKFKKAKIESHSFDYTPCLHIKTFRVAEVYGASVVNFKNALLSYFETV